MQMVMGIMVSAFMKRNDTSANAKRPEQNFLKTGFRPHKKVGSGIGPVGCGGLRL